MRDRIVRVRELEGLVGRDSVSIWRDERAGRFPKRLKIGPRAVGWLESEILEWLQKRAAERPPPTDEPEAAAKGARVVPAARKKI
jgi:prophage regulatory protein